MPSDVLLNFRKSSFNTTHANRSIALTSFNIAKTIKFYLEKLGFPCFAYEDQNYTGVTRDQIEMHF
jgi:hypothetical protein